MSLTPDEEWRWHAFVAGWEERRSWVSIGYTRWSPISSIHTIAASLYDAGPAAIAYNPFPRFHLWRFWR